MKKSLLFAGAIFLTSGIAIAKTIDFDTSIKWNSNVIELALEHVGLPAFAGSCNSNSLIARKANNRILFKLLQKESFSIHDATAVCLDECNDLALDKSYTDFMFNDCSDLCKRFGKILVDKNNALAENTTLKQDTDNLIIKVSERLVKLYTEDKKYYILWDHKANITGESDVDRQIRIYRNSVCNYIGASPIAILFSAEKDTPIALLRGEYGADNEEFRILNLCHIDDTPKMQNAVIVGRKKGPSNKFSEVPGIEINEEIKINNIHVYSTSNPKYQGYKITQQ